MWHRRRHFGHAPRVAASGEGYLQRGQQTTARDLWRSKTRAEGKDVGVVVLARWTRRRDVVTRQGEGHRLSAAADTRGPPAVRRRCENVMQAAAARAQPRTINEGGRGGVGTGRPPARPGLEDNWEADDDEWTVPIGGRSPARWSTSPARRSATPDLMAIRRHADARLNHQEWCIILHASGARAPRLNGGRR
jgi:hypothetical protein